MHPTKSIIASHHTTNRLKRRSCINIIHCEVDSSKQLVQSFKGL